MDRARGGLQFLEPERDGLVEQRVNDRVAVLGQVGVELHLAALDDVIRIRIPGRDLVAEGAVRQHRQARDRRGQQQLLALLAERELHEALAAGIVAAARHQRDVGRHDRGHLRIDELHREPRVAAREPEEIDHRAGAELAVVDAVGHAERALGDLRAVAGHLQDLAPALVPAFALQDGLHGQVHRARARRRGHRHVAEPLRTQQVGPLLGRRQLVGAQVAGVVHDPVAGQRLALVEPLGIVDRIVADLGRDRLVVDVGCGHQQVVALEHFEGVGRAGPEHVGPLAGRGLAHERNAGHRALVQDFDLEVGIALLERRLVGGGQLARKRGDHGHRLLGKRRNRGQRQHGQRRQPAGEAERSGKSIHHEHLMKMKISRKSKARQGRSGVCVRRSPIDRQTRNASA